MTNTKRLTTTLLLALVAPPLAILVGCDGEDDDAGSDELLEIAGSYTDAFGSVHTISESTWTIDDAQYEVSQFDSAAQYLVAQNSADNEYFPELWSRFDWVTAGGTLYYCQSAYDADDEAAALATARPDDTDPATMGCGGMFPWTALE